MSDSYTHQNQYGLDAARKVWLEDLGESIPCVTLEFFKQSVLPEISEATVDDTLKKLNTEIKEDRWEAFPQDPSEVVETENTTFESFPELCEKILAAGKEHMNDKEARLRFQASPAATMNSEADALHASYKVDGSAMLLKPKGAGTRRGNRLARNTPAPTSTTELRPKTMEKRKETPLSNDTSDSVCFWELKKVFGTKEVQDNVAKIIGAATHMIFNDPCRRFTFGMTIEDTTARFWFFSRFVVMVSMPFNFITEHRHLVHWVLSLGFATEVELGFDPTIERILDEGSIKYDIRVGGVWYRTIRSLDNHRASRLIGRATRVWVVSARDDPQAKPCVLKDVWIGNDARSELEILNDIFSRVNRVHKLKDFEHDYQEKYFMKIDADECVDLGMHEDRSPLIMRGHVVPDDCPRFSLSQEKEPTKAALVKGSGLPAPVGSTTSLVTLGQGNRAAQRSPYVHRCEARQHRRVLMPEIGHPLSELLTAHSELFSYLGQVLKGMRYLYSAGYVHRDISTGNLLLCGDGNCKMSDFEYAKVLEEVSGSNEDTNAPVVTSSLNAFKTGTPAFMAIEVQMGHYHVIIDAGTASPDSSDSEALSGDELVASFQKLADETFSEPKEELPFHHHYLHDVESLWWIGEWALFTTLPVSSPAHTTRLSITDVIFPHNVNGSDTRFLFILSKHYHKRITALLPAEFRASVLALQIARQHIAKRLVAFQQRPLTFRFARTYQYVHMSLMQAAAGAVSKAREAPHYKVPTTPQVKAPTPTSSKRAAPEGGEAQRSAGKRKKEHTTASKVET